jgi:hypothetical protein
MSGCGKSGRAEERDDESIIAGNYGARSRYLVDQPAATIASNIGLSIRRAAKPLLPPRLTSRDSSVIRYRLTKVHTLYDFSLIVPVFTIDGNYVTCGIQILP